MRLVRGFFALVLLLALARWLCATQRDEVN